MKNTQKNTQQLHEMGQSLWLDNITRALLTSGTLSRYISELAVTGLTSNPTIFDLAIKNTGDYDEAIRKQAAPGKSVETLFFELALEDLIQAADLFRPVHDATDGPVWVQWQEGTIPDAGVNGAQVEDVVSIAIERLRQILQQR